MTQFPGWTKQGVKIGLSLIDYQDPTKPTDKALHDLIVGIAQWICAEEKKRPPEVVVVENVDAPPTEKVCLHPKQFVWSGMTEKTSDGKLGIPGGCTECGATWMIVYVESHREVWSPDSEVAS